MSGQGMPLRGGCERGLSARASSLTGIFVLPSQRKRRCMAPTSKEAQRAEVHKTIWRIANDLRGSVDGWDFKTYVLGILFYRFISENLAAYINQQARGRGPELRLRAAARRQGRARQGSHRCGEGLHILPSELFDNVRERAPRDENLNETLERIFKNIEGSAVGADSGTTSKACSTT